MTRPILSLGGLHHRGKIARHEQREVREHLAVELDAGLLERGDEPRIRGAVLARSGVHARDPQRAEVAAAAAPVRRAVVERALDRLVRALVAVLAPAAEALGELQYAVAAAAGLESLLDAHRLLQAGGRRPVAALRFPAWALL